MRLVGDGAWDAADEFVKGHVPAACAFEPVEGGLVEVATENGGTSEGNFFS